MMLRKRDFTYCHCTCGMLVRLAALKEDTDVAKGLAQHNAHAFAGECPHCKTVSQLTVTNPSVIHQPKLVTT